MSRTTRSQSRQKQDEVAIEQPSQTSQSHFSELPNRIVRLKDPSRTIRYLTEQELGRQLNSLRKVDQQLLLSKRRNLQSPNPSTSDFNLLHQLTAEQENNTLARAISATLVFAGEAGGTAVSLSPDGLILTCAHCIAETAAEYRVGGRVRWLLFAAGDPVAAECVAWDPRRDLALLRISAALRPGHPSSAGLPGCFPHAEIAEKAPKVGARVICVGHPGSVDLEASEPGVATGYDTLHVSEGRFRGLAKGQDPQDNSEIGALMHDCWTYWGHSGAPLIVKETGEVIGLHSSWDDETGMRRGVGLEAIQSFLAEHTVSDPVTL